jgi:Flp pilus assembly protein TadB
MTILLATLGALIGAGLLLAIAGSRAIPRRTLAIAWPTLTWRSPWVVGTCLFVVGVLIAVVTGWLVAIIVAPLIGLGLPYLVGRSEGALDIAKLEAMEEWTRSLSGILTAGAGLEQSLVSTLGSTPLPIRTEVTRLVARLRARWSTAEAIRAFADDLGDPTGDIIAANLLLGTQRRGDGLATILEGLAESVAFDIRARRQVEADAAKPRATARWVTIITAIVLGGLFITGTYVAPYKSGTGQLILFALLAAYAAILMWMKRTASGGPVLRILGDKAHQGAM